MFVTKMLGKNMTSRVIIIQDYAKCNETTCHASIFLATQQRSIL